MKILRWISVIVLTIVIILGGGGYALFKIKNRPPQLASPNYFEVYKAQLSDPEAMTPVGNVGIFISHLIMPEDFRLADFHNLALKSRQYIPWPMRKWAGADSGVLLLDPDKFYETEAFVPKKLVDPYGSDTDVDGIAYVDKFHLGKIRWVAPSARRHLDHGYFLYQGRKGGMPLPAQKLINKARVYYYAKGKGFIDGKLPHAAGNWAIVEETLENIRTKYGNIPSRWVSAENFALARQYITELLDGGADTIIFAPPRPIYSHHEEFNGSIKHTMHYIHDWEKKNDKQIKVIVTPQLGQFPVIFETYANMLRDRLDTVQKGSDVKVVVSVHGMAWDLVPHEAWIELAPKYVEGTLKTMRNVLLQYDLGRTELVQSQDHFADPVNNPNGTYLSTNKAFWDGINDDYDYVINLPVEFFAENTDTMFSHAMFNFEHFPNFDIYEPVDYSDWSEPYTRTFNIDGTSIIYNGLPLGHYNKPIIAAYTMAIDSILSRWKQPSSSNKISTGDWNSATALSTPLH